MESTQWEARKAEHCLSGSAPSWLAPTNCSEGRGKWIGRVAYGDSAHLALKTRSHAGYLIASKDGSGG